MTFVLGKKSLERLQGVHPDLVKVVKLAISRSEIDFTVTEGLRTNARQAQLFKAGASKTMNSRHITGHAIDLAAWVEGGIRWDWPLYAKLAKAMKSAATELNVPVIWGGDWRTFRDGPHFELDRKVYP